MALCTAFALIFGPLGQCAETMATASELAINQNASATQMAQTIFGSGVALISANYDGSRYSSGTYSGGDATSPS
jgi:hypothetical protein